MAGSRRNPESNSEIVFLGIGLYQNFNGGYVFNSNWTANANHGPFYLNNNSAVDTRKLYVYEGSDWHILLSREFSDMLNYEDYIVQKSEVSVKGAGISIEERE